MILLRFALRASRLGVFATTVIAGFNGLAQAVAYGQLAGGTELERQVFAQQMLLLGQQLSYVIPPPVELDTAAGYVQWRVFGSLPLLYGFWALLSSTGAARGDEDRGLVEQFLAAGASRARYLAARVASFAILAAASVIAVVAATGVGIAAAGETAEVGPLLEQAGAIWAMTLACYGIGLLAAQIAGTRRSAGALAAAVLMTLFLVNSAARIGAAPEGLRPLTPFYHYEVSQPLVGGALDVGSTIVLLAMAAAAIVLAALAFQRRDVGTGLVAPRATGRPVTTPSRDPLLRLPVVALLDQQRFGILAWTLATVLFGLFLISISRTIVDLMTAIPVFRVMLERAGVDAYGSFIGSIWFGTLVFLITIYAITQVSAWIEDEREGRLEMQLAAPVSRARVVLERVGALFGGAALIAAGAAVITLVGTAREGVALPPGDVARASILLLPVALAFGAMGEALIGWRASWAVPLLGAVATASYFIDQLGPLFDLPEWARNLSVFALYGTPLTGAVDWMRVGALLAITILGLAVGIATFRRRDVMSSG